MDYQKLLYLLNREDVHIKTYDRLTSTNDQLAKLIATENAPPGTVVIAKQQTAGRGQRGKEWTSPVGGLYLSMVIAPNLPATNAHQLTLGLVWGIAHSLRQEGIPVTIKWPNDLMLNGRKLGGILTETRILSGNIRTAIVGVGINHSNPVEIPAINLAPSNNSQPNYRNITIEMLATSTIRGIINGYQHCTPVKIDTLLSDYLELLEARGRSVMVNGKLGTVLGISPQGELHIGFSTATEVNEIYLTPGTFTLGYQS